MSFDCCSDEELIVRLRSGENEIMDYILEKYKPLVRKKTNALYLIGGENEDLIQEGMIGVFKAVRDYNEDKDCSFASFAQLCISRQLYISGSFHTFTEWTIHTFFFFWTVVDYFVCSFQNIHNFYFYDTKLIIIFE